MKLAKTLKPVAALVVIVTTLLPACGGSQPPIGAPGTMPQPSAHAARTKGANYSVIYSFSGSPDGVLPLASLIDRGGTLYGTTAGGGSYCGGCGTVFSVSPDGTEKVLHSFGESPDGNGPDAGLIDVNGTFYGTTSGGGSYTEAPRCTGSDYFPCGTVFSITRNGAEQVLHSFGNGTDGLDPEASLIEVNGTLYGTTEHGGTHNNKCNGGCGTVFSVTPNGTYKVLRSFRARSDGARPVASLIEVNRKLYGTTQYGGTYGFGTVFSITLSGRERE